MSGGREKLAREIYDMFMDKERIFPPSYGAADIAIAYADRRVAEAVGEAKALVLANARLREIEQKYVDMLVDVVPKRVALVEEIIDIVKSVEPGSWVPTSTEFVNTHVIYQHALGDVVTAIRIRALSPAREGEV